MKLEPELEPPRTRVDRRVLVLCGTAAIAFAGSAVLALRSTPPATEKIPIVVTRPLVIAIPPKVQTIQVVQQPDPEPPQHTVEGTSELAHFVDAWLNDPNAEWPVIEYRRGIVFIESAEDRGDDGPYPKSADPEAQRVCGSAAVWLRDHLRKQLAYTELTCTETECTYPGMEYAPDGRLTFHTIDRDGAKVWAIDGWTQEYVAGLGEAYARANSDFVERATARLAHTTCPGEPLGAYY
ncbi:MAG TPA: hypothetical protein VL463_08865 [Kofleriaceae bacterium]|nr:hypothetical protein [Kofleriaceae bacterium]